MTRNTRIALLAAAAVVAVVAIVIIGSGGDDQKDSSTAAQTTTAATQSTGATTAPAKPAIQVVTIKGGKAVGGVQTVTVKKGERARFKVVSDADYEIHLHGFDIAKDVKAGGSVSYDVKTDAPGIYEFEIEDTGTKIGQVKVEP
jgi:FtsP/CotA-like multicopper oxidase with cupredoxin domain